MSIRNDCFKADGTLKANLSEVAKVAGQMAALIYGYKSLLEIIARAERDGK
jgi:hypothetical protein